MTDQDAISIRSFRVVFDLERRIHKIDRIRLPLPYGLPLRSIAYAIAILAAVVAVSRLPVAGAIVAVLPLPVRVAVIPALAAYLLTQISPDGRPAHSFLLAWTAQRLQRSRYVAFAAAPGERTERLADLVVAPDERGPRLRRGTVCGPALVLLRQPVQASAYDRTVILGAGDEQTLFCGRRLELDAGQRAVVR